MWNRILVCHINFHLPKDDADGKAVHLKLDGRVHTAERARDQLLRGDSDGECVPDSELRLHLQLGILHH